MALTIVSRGEWLGNPANSIVWHFEVETSGHVTLTGTVKTNMAEVNDLYLFEDDFGTILEILEDEEELDEQFREAAIEVSVSNFYSILKYHEKLRLMRFESQSFGAGAGAGAVMNFMCHSKLTAKFPYI